MGSRDSHSFLVDECSVLRIPLPSEPCPLPLALQH